MATVKPAVEVPKAEPKVEPSVSKTVKMVRSNTVPSEADVHVDEVEHWKLHGWSLK